MNAYILGRHIGTVIGRVENSKPVREPVQAARKAVREFREGVTDSRWLEAEVAADRADAVCRRRLMYRHI